MNSSAQSANVSGHDNIVVQASGSGVNVAIGAKPYLRLTQYERRTRLAERDNSEAALLSAYRADVVPLIGRDGAMADLRRWLDDPAALSVRVLFGPGGRGKTRLALELARDIAKDGWLAGFVKSTADEDELDRFRSQNGVHEWRWDKPILIIIDYAASRAAQLRNWLRELVDASFEDRPKLRLLLLERQANRAIGWLATIFGRGDNDDSRAAIALLDPQEPVELPALDELEFRRQVFGALLKRANGALAAPTPDTDPEFDRLLADRKWAGDPLYLMMAGLAAAKAGVHGALTLSRADLALSTARNELDRIGRIGAARGVDEKHQLPGAFARHMAAIATLTQGLTVAEARSLAAREIEALRSMAALDAALAALTDSLPAADSSSGVAPILPDIVGEGAILAWFGPNGGLATIGVDPQTRIAAAARTALAKVSATLVRTAQDFAAAGYAEPVQWLEALAVAPDTDLGALIGIADALPHRTLALVELAAALETRIAKSLRAVAAGEVDTGRGGPAQVLYAHTLDNLANRWGALGRREEALEVIQEAVRIQRRLAGERPDTSNPALAVSLNNLGLILSELGSAERALTATEESVEVRRRLAAEQPERYLPDLAGVLNNLGKLLDEQGRREDALKAAEESVEIYRRLAAERPDAFLPDLAISLLNLGKFLGELGRLEQALAATLEATDLCRRLAAERPDAFLPDLLRSLSNLRTRLCALGRREDALKATREAVDVSRRLASMQSEAFSADLAISLDNLGNDLSELGRHEDALKAAEESSEIRRRLVAERPDRFLPGLAVSLHNLGIRLGELGRGQDALAAAQEAVNIRRRLVAERPDRLLPELVESLHNLSARLGEVGRREDALEAAQEAVEVCSRSAQRVPGGILGRVLNNLGNKLLAVGRLDDALKATREAVEVFRGLSAERPDVFLPDLAASLNNLGIRLGVTGQPEDALKAAEESVEVRRRLVADQHDRFFPDLAESLNNLGIRLSEVGRREDALAAAQEAVDINRRLAADRPDRFLPNLAGSLSNLGIRFRELGRREDAFTAAQEAVDIYRQLAAVRPDAFLTNLGLSLDNLGVMLGALDRHELALKTTQEAVDIGRRLSAERSDGFLPDLGRALNNLALWLSAVGRHGNALLAAREAVTILAPVFLKLPAAHAELMMSAVRQYLELSQRVGVEPDAALLTRIVEAFQKLQDSTEPSNPNA